MQQTSEEESVNVCERARCPGRHRLLYREEREGEGERESAGVIGP
jgi:hypothetical protein